MASPLDENKIRNTQQQLTAQEALLAAILPGGGGGSSTSASSRIPTGGLFGSSCPQPILPMLHTGQSNPIQDLYTYQNRIQSLTNAAAAAAASGQQQNATNPLMAFLLGAGTGNATLLDAQRNLNRLQSIREQALALTDDNPFTSRSVLQNQVLSMAGAGGVGGHLVPQQQPQMDREGTLKALGSSMRTKNSPYIDASSLSDPDPQDLARRRTRGGVTEPFPERLHRMLEEVEKDGEDDIVSFFSHGRAFGVHDPERFVSKIMPKFFKQSRLSSFQRQLNLYGFVRISSGPDAGGYYHELFLKGRPALCIHMRRVGVPKGEDRRKTKSGVRMVEPDFYSMKKVDTEEETPKQSPPS